MARCSTSLDCRSPAVGLVPTKTKGEVADCQLEDCRTDEQEGEGPDEDTNQETQDSGETSPSSFSHASHSLLLDDPDRLGDGDGGHGEEVCVDHHVPESGRDGTEA